MKREIRQQEDMLRRMRTRVIRLREQDTPKHTKRADLVEKVCDAVQTVLDEAKTEE